MKIHLLINVFCLFIFTSVFAEKEIVVPQTLLDQVENGNAEAAYFIATIYNTGTSDLKSNLQLAKKWMQKAAEMDYPQAMYEWAQMLSREDNKTKALDWYLKAITYGHSDSFNSVALYHYNGYAGLDKNCSKAYDYFETAMAKENKQAMNNYAWFLATSMDPSCRNPEKSLKVFYQLKSIYTKADEIIPWHVWDTESAVLASVSDFAKAIKNQNWLIDKMKEEGFDTNEYEKHLKTFEQRKAWIE